jgi:cytochrome c-type biogenesis protein CcmH
MQAFYLFSGLMICFALFLLIYPLIKAASDNGFRAQTRKTSGELKSVAALKAGGVIDAAAYEKSRRELADTLLKALEAPVKSNRTPMLVGAFFLSCVPLAVMGVYKAVGAPGGLSFAPPALAAQNSTAPNAAATAATAAAPEQTAGAPAAAGMDLKKAAEGLRARLDAAPDDGPGWELLGRTYFEIEDFANAAESLAKAIKILPKSAELYAQHGEAVMNAARPNMPPPEAEASLDQALAIDGKNQNALWLKGVSRKLAGDANAALANWTLLAEQLPPGSESAKSVGEQIEVLRVELGLSAPSAAPPAAAILTEPAVAETAVAPVEPAAASTDATVTLEITLSPELKKQLGPNDVLFVFAKAASGPPAPLAAHRSPAIALNADAPVRITLSDADAMMPSMKLSMFPQITLGARVSKSGVANATSGDFQVLSEALTQPVNGVLKLEISEVLP